MNFFAASVMATVTEAPAWTSLLVRSAVLYAAIPPVTPIRISRFWKASTMSLGFRGPGFSGAGALKLRRR